jgi:CHAD domain-containing protein
MCAVTADFASAAPGAAAPAPQDAPPPAPPPTDVTAGPPLAAAGARVMLEQLARIERFEAGARDGDDPEDVHRMRVATRRLRAARRVFKGALDGASLDRANEALKALAAALGTVRDLDVFVAALRARAAEAPEEDRPALARLIATREQTRPAAQAALRALLDGGTVDYLRREFKRQLEAIAAETGARAHTGKGRRPVRRAAPRLIGRALRRLYRDEAALLAPTSEELHARRILAKRARYAGEFFAPAFGKALDAPVERLTAAQDVLGEVHDADVAVAVLLGEIERVSRDAATAADAGPLARLVAQYAHDRDARLAGVRERWRALPRPQALRRALQHAG